MRKPYPRRYVPYDADPRKYVTWTPKVIKRMNKLINSGYSRRETAEILTIEFPQDNGVIFTKNSVIGKEHRL